MTKEVQIPFLDRFQDVMLSGRKTWTGRTRKYGEKGDVFRVFGATFKFVEVTRRFLCDVKWLYYKEEGFTSPEEFAECWIQIHKRKGYDPDQLVWVHVFKRTEEAQKT